MNNTIVDSEGESTSEFAGRNMCTTETVTFEENGIPLKTGIYDLLREKFIGLIKENNVESEQVIIKAEPLTPEQAIGNPEDKDYPLVIGKERLMQAEFRGALGQAYTDMYGNFDGRISDIVTMKLNNNFRRAIFISSLNAVMRHLGMIDKTVHCRDNEPRECSAGLLGYMDNTYGNPRIAIVGFQPRMVETLSRRFDIRVTDLDHANIGGDKSGITIGGPEKTGENLDWCDIALVSGTTIVNDTIGQFMISKPTIFYGVTISGVARLLGLNQFCYFGH